VRTRPRHRAVLALAVVALLAAALAGCGVPVDRAPAALPRDAIPFGLLRPSSPTTTTTSVSSPVDVTVHIYLVSASGHLVSVPRELPAAQNSLGTVLGVLVAGPTNIDVAEGLDTAIPAQTTVLAVAVGANDVATVNLGGTFGQLVGQAQIQAVAQIVFTAATLPGVAGVTFELAGKPVSVPDASGAEVPVANPSLFSPLAPVPVKGQGG
jgi:spore germination protein GerM